MAKSCGPDSLRVGVKFALRSADDGDKKAGSPGRARISLKPLRGEGRSVSAEPVRSCAFLLVHFAHETAGAACTRSSLRPLLGGQGSLIANLGRNAPRDREGMFESERALFEN